MTRLRRALRGLAIAVGGLLLLVLLVALGFNVESEWRVHTAVALPPPAVDLPAPGATPGSPECAFVLMVRPSYDFETLASETASDVQVIEAPRLDADRKYNVPAVALLALALLAALFTEIYAPATGIDLWLKRREDGAR